jgi:hypothetical protein
MIFAAMVEDVIWEGPLVFNSTIKLTVSIIDIATQWKIRDVSFAPISTEDELQYELASAADRCVREYGYFLASI